MKFLNKFGAKDDLSVTEERGRLYKLQPFVKAEHGDWPPHKGVPFGDDTVAEPSGYRHPRGVNRAGRRRMWGMVSNRRQRRELHLAMHPHAKLPLKSGFRGSSPR